MTTPREPWQVEEARKRLEEVKRKHQPAIDALADAEKRLEDARAALAACRAKKRDAGKAERRIAQETLAAWEVERRARGAERVEIERRRDEARSVYNQHRERLRAVDDALVELRKRFEEERQVLLAQKAAIGDDIKRAALAVDDVLRELVEARSAGVYTVSDERQAAREARITAKTEIARLEGVVAELETKVAELGQAAEPARDEVGKAEMELANWSRGVR